MIEQIQVRGLTDLQTLQGVASGADDLGAFTGSTITDNVTIKVALQELETKAELPFTQSADDLSDVTYSGAPAVGQMLIWEAVNGWVNKQALSVNIGVDTTNFNNNLSVADDTVQKALETLDDIAAGSTAVGVATNTASFNGILSAADTNVQLALDTIDDIDYANGTAYANHVADGTIHYTQASISIPASQVSDFDTEVSNNASVAANTAHAIADGKSHSDVVLNNAHRTSDGKNHSDVVLNNAHRISTGADHTYINQSVTTAASPAFVNATLSGKTAGSIPFFGAGGVVSEDNSNLYWDNVNKRIGVGTSSPLANLHVSGGNVLVADAAVSLDLGYSRYLAIAGTGPALALVETDTSAEWTISSLGSVFRIRDSDVGADRVTIDGAGMVGIGTASPNYTLDVNGTFRAVGQSTLNGIVLTTTGPSYGAGVLGYTDTNWGFIFRPPQAGGTGAHLFEAFDGTDLFSITEAGAVYIPGSLSITGATVVGDHGTASTDQVVNVSYGTSATPPTASTTTEGSLYIQYTD